MNELHRNGALRWFLFGSFCLAVLSVLGWRTLVPPDEGRYAEVAREMFESGDWVTLRLNYINYFEKPPLQTWMTALAYSLFGVGEWQARLWTGLSGIASVALAWFTGRRLFGERTGFYAGLVLASSFCWVAASQVSSLDTGMAAMMTLALCALLIAQRDCATARERRNWMLVCWAGMALAVLSKGLPGIVLPGAVLVIYMLVTRDWRLFTRLHFGKGLLLFFAITAPWFVIVGLRNPEQPYYFFIHEHFVRFLTNTHGREGAWWTYFALLAAGTLPWAAVLAQSLFTGARRSAGGEETPRFRPRLLLVTWVVFITLFYTNSSSKLPGYLLPVFPAAALLVACHLEHGTRRSRIATAGLAAVLGAVLLALVPFAGNFASKPGDAPLYLAYQPWLLAGGFILLAGALVSMLYARQMQRDLMVISLAVSGFISTQLLLAGFEPIGRVRAGVNLLPAMQAELTPATKLYAVHIYEQSLTFYLKRPIKLVELHDEFIFGLRQRPELGIRTTEEFLAQWRADVRVGRHAMAIVPADLPGYMEREGVPARVVAADARRTIISNR